MKPLAPQLHTVRKRHPLRWRLGLVIGVPVVAAIGVFGGTTIGNAGHIYHGVYLNGVDVGGMSKKEAAAALNNAAEQYGKQTVAVSYATPTSTKTTLRFTPDGIGAKYDEAAVDEAFEYARQGTLRRQMYQRIQLVLGRTTNVQRLQFDDARLAGYVAQVGSDVTTPVANAGLAFNDGRVTVTPSSPGTRLDTGKLVAAVQARLGAMSTAEILAPSYRIDASVDEKRLASARGQAEQIAGKPLTVKADSKTIEVGIATITSWIQVGGKPTLPYAPTALKGYYPAVDSGDATVALNQQLMGAYVNTMAGSINQQAKDAELGVQDGKVVAVKASQNGLSINQQEAVTTIMKSLNDSGSDRNVTLKTQVTRPTVREDNLQELGLVEQISQGQTLFPGSPSTRMINVRTGASKMNNVLIKPGENFSFNDTLGHIGPETGYVPELVILEKHEEKQYGGGLCQVSSTVYRAALLAGLPITQRVNHSFAISYYTAPYGVPGVDATIYPPSGVDMRFRNDTGHYIFMQTRMVGTTLTATFYGTKTKTGEIRGPNFITGNQDTTQPSHTVFYRDVKDLSGKVIKTDTVETYYKSSSDFPILNQIN